MVKIRWPRSLRNDMFMAFHKWEKVFEIEGGRDAENLIKFAEFTGDPFHEDKRNMYVNTENPEVMEKVDLINGPNGYTLLKMWKHQQ